MATPKKGGRFQDRAVFITGGGRGIGRAIARAFGAEGARLMLASREEAKLREAAGEISAMGARAEIARVDVTDEEAVRRAIERTARELGGLDVLINNAGVPGPARLAAEIAAEEWGETLAVNLTGAFYCAKHAARIMLEQGLGGAIVNVSSIAGRIGYGLRTPYAASKWGMIGLSHSLAVELAPHGIRVNCVCPGATEGERLERVIRERAEAEGISLEESRRFFIGPTPLGRTVTADEVARAVLYFADAEASSGVVGQALNVDGGFRMQ